MKRARKKAVAVDLAEAVAVDAVALAAVADEVVTAEAVAADVTKSAIRKFLHENTQRICREETGNSGFLFAPLCVFVGEKFFIARFWMKEDAPEGM